MMECLASGTPEARAQGALHSVLHSAGLPGAQAQHWQPLACVELDGGHLGEPGFQTS